MKKTLFATSALAIGLAFASVAAADGIGAGLADPVVIAPADSISWTGFYGGLSATRAEIPTAGVNQIGVFGGYRHEIGGGFVLGGELEAKNHSDARTYAAKAQLGLDAGNFLPYATVGYMKADVGALSVEDTVYGAGLDYHFGPKTVVGIEYLQADDSFDAKSLTARLGFRF